MSALFIGPPVACGEEPPPATVGVATHDSADDLSPSIRSTIRFATMSLLKRAGATSCTKYGLCCDESANAAIADAAVDKPYVILVHGFNSTPERCATLLKPIHDAGYRCGTMQYPNDQSIVDSAALLSRELKDFAKREPDTKFSLVTYSMGGLVAREALENVKLDPGNVRQLIMVAPPTHGSSCARIVCSGDLWEHGVDGHGGLLNCVYACVEDGLGEARHDLVPESPFLKRLNSRKLNERIRYSILLGTAGPFSPAGLILAKKAVRQSAEANEFVNIIRPALDKTLDDLHDAVEDGDGVVTVARGRLEGVSDTVLLGFNHWNVVNHPEDETVAAVHREILKRLSTMTAKQM
ncbi:MAG: hypothetical protein IT427_17520 [Pirellulales bacterium]|nr:hypothetical protein [Pirellulales bacterium]